MRHPSGTGLGALLALALLTAAGGEAPHAPVRRALLVGIGRYPPAVHWPVLEGPDADVGAMREVLVGRFGFQSGDVVELKDEAATHAGIAAALAAIVQASSAGDLILFYFAGHGSRLPDDDPGEETDGWDETLVPYDACTASRRDNDIRDDEIGRWIASANARTDQVVLVFDCCSSGTNVRDEGPGRSRYLSDAARGFDAPRTLKAPAGDRAGSGWMPPRARCVALSACRAQESAFEIRTEGSSPARYRGLFTMSLVDELSRAGPDASWCDLMQLVSARVAGRTTRQTPVIEGALAGYGIFRAVAPSRAPRFEADFAGSREVRVHGGLLQGLTPGAVLSVCGAGAAQDDAGAHRGEIEIVDASAGESLARWRLPPAADHAEGACTTFLLEAGSLFEPLPVSLEGDGLEALVASLAATHLVRRVDPADARYRIVVAAPGQAKLLDASGKLLCGLALDCETAIARLAGGLATLGRAWRADQLLPASAARGLRAEMSVRLLGEAREDGSRPILGTPERDERGRLSIPAGAAWSVFVANRSEVPIYASFVLVFPDGEIAVPCASGPDDRIDPGGAEGRCIPGELEIPPALAAFYAEEPVRLYGVWTPRWHDLSALAQEPFSIGPGTRGAQAWSASGLTDEAWSTASLEISVR